MLAGPKCSVEDEATADAHLWLTDACFLQCRRQWTQSQGMAVILCMDQWQLEASLCSACASEGITRMVNGAGCGGSSATTRGDEEKRSGSWGPK